MSHNSDIRPAIRNPFRLKHCGGLFAAFVLYNVFAVLLRLLAELDCRTQPAPRQPFEETPPC